MKSWKTSGVTLERLDQSHLTAQNEIDETCRTRKQELLYMLWYDAAAKVCQNTFFLIPTLCFRSVFVRSTQGFPTSLQYPIPDVRHSSRIAHTLVYLSAIQGLHTGEKSPTHELPGLSTSAGLSSTILGFCPIVTVTLIGSRHKWNREAAAEAIIDPKWETKMRTRRRCSALHNRFS